MSSVRRNVRVVDEEVLDCIVVARPVVPRAPSPEIPDSEEERSVPSLFPAIPDSEEEPSGDVDEVPQSPRVSECSVQNEDVDVRSETVEHAIYEDEGAGAAQSHADSEVAEDEDDEEDDGDEDEEEVEEEDEEEDEGEVQELGSAPDTDDDLSGTFD